MLGEDCGGPLYLSLIHISPVKAGQVVVPNVLGTGADIVATRSMEKGR